MTTTPDWWSHARLKIEGGLSHPTDFAFEAESFAADVQAHVYAADRVVVWEMEIDADGDIAIFDAEDDDAIVALSADSLTFVTSELTPPEVSSSEKVTAQARLVAELFTNREIPRVDECWIKLSCAIDLDDRTAFARLRELISGQLGERLKSVVPPTEVSEVSLRFDRGSAQCLFRLGQSPSSEVLAQLEVREPGDGYRDFFERSIGLASDLTKSLIGLALKE